MRKILLILSFFITSFCYANDELQKVVEQMSNFYLSPTEANFIQFQKSADKFENQFKSSGNSADIMVALMTARISEKHKWPIQQSFFSGQAKEILEGKTDLAKFLNNDEEVTPAKLDFWWASYFATGEEQYLLKILKFAGEEMPKGDIAKLLVISAATWSFKSNCKQHKTIRDFALKKSQDNGISKHKKNYLIESVDFADGKST